MPVPRQTLAPLIEEALREVRRQELERGVSLVGPHRDELVLQLGGMPARGFASHGESWSLALALRLAAFELLRADGDDPVLILDDVFAELDTGRRRRLAELVAPAEQVLITSAVGEELPEGLADVPAVSTHVVTVRDTDDGRISLLDADGDADR